jgi:hypothetical protein
MPTATLALDEPMRLILGLWNAARQNSGEIGKFYAGRDWRVDRRSES